MGVSTVSLIDKDSLFFIVLFVIPGAAKVIYDVRLAKLPTKTSDEKYRMSGLLLFSVAVFALNSALFNWLYVAFIHQPSIFEPIWRALAIAAINVATSFAYCFLLNCGSKLYYQIKNKALAKKEKPTHAEYGNMWQLVFHGQELHPRGNVVKIENGGVCAVGALKHYSDKSDDDHAVVLQYTTEIAEYFEEDKTKPEDQRTFWREAAVYHDLDKGFTITLYDMERYFAYQDAGEGPTLVLEAPQAPEEAAFEETARV